MTDNLRQAITDGLSSIRIQPPLTGAEWADKYFYLSPESSGIEGKWKCYPYQIGPINWMCDDDIEEINWRKSARVGYTKCLLIAIGYGVEHKRRNLVVWQPTDGDAKDFSADEVDTMLRDVSVVGDLLKCGVGSKSKFNTTEKKSFIGATLDIKGGKSGRNYRRMTKDGAFYDETDGFDVDVDNEGSPFELGDTRIQTSSFPKSIRGSTPRLKHVSLIDAAVNESDRIFYRYLPCPQCGNLHRLEFANLEWGDSPDNARFVCPENGCVIEYKDYPAMDSGGRWQTIDGYYYDEKVDCFYNPNNEQIERPKKIGVIIWAAYSYFTTWADTAKKWVDAARDAKTGNKSKLKTVINTRLGEAYEEKGESVEAVGFMSRLEDYTPDRIPDDVLAITAGADVQGGKNPRVELEILGHGLEGESWSIDYVVIPGDPEQKALWDHVEDQLTRTFFRDDGIELGIRGAFIDSGYMTTEVYRFTGPRAKRNVYATKGVNTGTICNKGSWQGDKKKKSRCILRTVNVDEAKEIVFKRIVKESGPGACHWPVGYDQKYFDQLTNEEKKEKRKSGRLVGYEWKIKKEHIGNEPLDCRAYSLGCLEFLNLNMSRIKARLEDVAERKRLELPPRPKKGRRIRSHGVARA